MRIRWHRLHLPFIMTLFVLFLLGVAPAAAQGEAIPLAFETRWSPDGRWLSVGSGAGLWLFETETFTSLILYGDERVYTAAFDPVRPQMAIPLPDKNQVAIVSLETGDTLFAVDLPNGPEESFAVMYDLVYSPDGRLLAASNTSLIYVIDAETGAVQRTLYQPLDNPTYGYSQWITALRFSSNSNTVFATDWAGRLLTYHLGETLSTESDRLVSDYGFEQIEPLPEGEGFLLRAFGALMTYVPGTESLVSALDPAVSLPAPIDLDSLMQVAGEGADPEQVVHGFDLAADASQIALGHSTSWTLFDRLAGRPTATVTIDDAVPDDRVYSLAFSPDGTRLATLSSTGHLLIWDVASGSVITSPFRFRGGVNPRWG